MRAWILTIPRITGYNAVTGATTFQGTVQMTGAVGQGDLIISKQYTFQMLDSAAMTLNAFRTASKNALLALRDQLHAENPTWGFDTLDNSSTFTMY